MSSPATIIETLESRYAENIRVVASELDDLREEIAIKEGQRDLLIRESAPVLRRAKAAEVADLSVSRVEQIIANNERKGLNVKDDLDTRKEVLANTIKRTAGVKKVAFDGEDFVYVGPVEREGEEVAERYRLGQDARRFLAGEFPLESIDDGNLILLLEAPGQEGDDN
jgi:hypothetical protein